MSHPIICIIPKEFPEFCGGDATVLGNPSTSNRHRISRVVEIMRWGSSCQEIASPTGSAVFNDDKRNSSTMRERPGARPPPHRKYRMPSHARSGANPRQSVRAAITFESFQRSWIKRHGCEWIIKMKTFPKNSVWIRMGNPEKTACCRMIVRWPDLSFLRAFVGQGGDCPSGLVKKSIGDCRFCLLKYADPKSFNGS